MAEKSKKPAIRFAGFTDAWEQRKLGELGTTFTGLSGKSKGDFGHGDARFITYMNVFSNPIADLSMTESVEIDFKQNCVTQGDVFFTTSSETPEEVGMSCVMPENIDNMYLNSFCFGYRPIEKFDLSYLAYALRSTTFRKGIIFLAQGISRYNISKNKAMDLEISVPSLEEQGCIGRYFNHLDNLITLHQRKYDKLVNVKKAMLEKMFPKDGADVPEIRFKGFTEAWEQRKLGSLAIFNPKAELPNVFEYVDLESVVGTEMLSHRTESKRTAPSRAQRLAQTGDLFYQTVRPYQKNNFLFEKSDKYYVFSTGYAQMRPVVDGLFLLCIVQSNGFMKVVLDNCTGTSYPAIKSNDLAEIEVYSPINPKEQEYIGKLFKGIDNLITLHQRKLEKLKNLKKACLEKMFV